MKEAFLFLIMARMIQFFIGNQGSRKYVKGFIGIITLVIIMQSVVKITWKEGKMEWMINDVLNDDLINDKHSLLPNEWVTWDLEDTQLPVQQGMDQRNVSDIVIPKVEPFHIKIREQQD